MFPNNVYGKKNITTDYISINKQIDLPNETTSYNATGNLRYNTVGVKLQFYNGSSWIDLESSATVEQWEAYSSTILKPTGTYIGIKIDSLDVLNNTYVKAPILMVDGTTTPTWQSIVAGSDAYSKIVLGQLSTHACIGSHNSGLTAWDTLYLNSDGTNGSTVIIGTDSTSTTASNIVSHPGAHLSLSPVSTKNLNIATTGGGYVTITSTVQDMMTVYSTGTSLSYSDIKIGKDSSNYCAIGWDYVNNTGFIGAAYTGTYTEAIIFGTNYYQAMIPFHCDTIVSTGNTTVSITSNIVPTNKVAFSCTAPSVTVAEFLFGKNGSNCVGFQTIDYSPYGASITLYVGAVQQNYLTFQSNLTTVNSSYLVVKDLLISSTGATTDAGAFWYDSTTNTLRYYNGTAQMIVTATAASAKSAEKLNYTKITTEDIEAFKKVDNLTIENKKLKEQNVKLLEGLLNLDLKFKKLLTYAGLKWNDMLMDVENETDNGAKIGFTGQIYSFDRSLFADMKKKDNK